METLDITQIVQHHRKPIVCIQTFKTGDDGALSLERTLNEIDPGYVILYHANVTAIRQIEVYEARKRRAAVNRLKVFFMVHAQTVEEQSYLTSLRREKQAFELIIDTKKVSIEPIWESLWKFCEKVDSLLVIIFHRKWSSRSIKMEKRMIL